LKRTAFTILFALSIFAATAQQADTAVVSISLPETPAQQSFRPNPNKAVLYSAIVPGLGQIYNRKYWKLPLVYGSFLGCAYAITWNGNMHSGYRQAYLDFIDDNPATNSWRNYISSTLRFPDDVAEWDASDVTWFSNTLKRKKDYYNHYRDMSIIVSAVVYAVWIIDAYVDAQLFEFDISRDLSMDIRPAVFEKTQVTSKSFGMQMSMRF
jgi:hypothetical protein